MTEFLHELIKKRERENLIQELLESDPWRYSEPPPPFTGNAVSLMQGEGPY